MCGLRSPDRGPGAPPDRQPHVVRVHDLGETGRQQPYLVLEYADRGTLADRVAQMRTGGWRATAADVLAVALPLAAALDAVHAADVVHRDLSPGNVLLRSARVGGADGPVPSPAPLSAIVDGGALLLADLGLCKDLAVNSGRTAAGGTEGFRPPELRSGPAVIDGTADLWSLSALLVWLITGHPPDDDSVLEPVVAAGLPASLAAVLDQSLSEDPQSRHSDPSAWLAAVVDSLALPNELSSTERESLGPEGNQAASRRGRRRRRLMLGAGAVLAAAVLVAGLASTRGWFGGGPDITSTGEGGVRVARMASGASAAIIGPTEVAVGETAVFEADLDGVDEMVWLAPDGRLLEGKPFLEVDTTSPGTAPVTLIGVDPEAEPITVTHELRVTAAD